VENPILLENNVVTLGLPDAKVEIRYISGKLFVISGRLHVLNIKQREQISGYAMLICFKSLSGFLERLLKSANCRLNQDVW